MNISSISNQTAAQFQPSLDGPFKQRFQDFKALQSALKSGNLSDAQSAFTALQNDIQNAPKNSAAGGSGTQASQDLQALGDALKSGDVSAAQKAFETLKQDLQAMRGQHHHGHHKAANDGDADDGANAASGTTAAASASANSASTILNALA